MKNLWVESHRPPTTEGYVWKDESQKRQVKGWIADGAIPHLLFAGSSGTGKTTLAYILLNELGVPQADILKVNASQENSVDTVRNKIVNFVSTFPLGEFKYVLLDEFDYMTPPAQGILRNLMETYSSSCRFILTCNYGHKVIPAIKSRCQEFHFSELNKDEFASRIAEILLKEGVDLNETNLEMLDTYIEAAYPDLRKCINMLQQNCMDGVLRAPNEATTDASDYLLKMIDYFKQGKITEARKLLSGQIRPEEYEDLYRFMYRNLDLWGKDEATQNEAIVVIAKGLRNHALAADSEINFSAVLVELANLKKG